LFPEGRMVPESAVPPSTMYCTAAMTWEGSEGEGCLTLDFGAHTIRDHVKASRLARPHGGLSLAHTRAAAGRADDSLDAEG
jgi:hypothetical protein